MSHTLDARTLAQHTLRALRRPEQPTADTMTPPFQSSAEFTAIHEQDHLKTIERLLAEAQKNNRKRGILGLLNRTQRRHNKLALEILSHLFNGYRAMRYQTSLLTEAAAQSQSAHLEAMRLAAVEAQDARARIEEMEKICRELRAGAGA